MASVRKREWGPEDAKSSSWEVSWLEEGKQRKKAGFKTKRDAQAWSTNKEKDLLDGVSRPDAHRARVADVATEYLANVDMRVAQNFISRRHAATVSAHFRNYINRPTNWSDSQYTSNASYAKVFKGTLAGHTLAAVRPAVIDGFIANLLATGMHPLTVRAVLRSLHHFFEFCRKRDYISINPAARIKVETRRDQRSERVTPPSRQLLDKVMNHGTEKLRFRVLFACATGLRAGEMRALRWKHVSFTERRVQVEVSLDEKMQEQPPKTEAGRRSIPIGSEFLIQLSAYRRGSRFCSDDDLVFPNRSGGYLQHDALRDQLVIACAEARGKGDLSGLVVPTKFTWHSLRHYAISSWIAAGLGLKAVQVFAGHADVSTTWNRYGHLFPDEAHWDKMDAAYSLTLK